MTKKFFYAKKHILSSGREIDLSADEEPCGTISMLAMFNQLDRVHEITKPVSVRLEWPSATSEPFMSLECRGGSPGDSRPVSESEQPIEGLNGEQEYLRAGELLELIEFMYQVHSKLNSELRKPS